MKTPNIYAVLLQSVANAVAYNPNEPAWKMEGDKIAMKDGNPVYLNADGAEMTIDFGTIGRLNNEAATHRKAKETAETKLKNFEGIDPVKAREAFELLSKVDQKKLIDAGEVDKVRNEISSAFQTQIGEKDKALETLQGRINGMTLDGAFSGSAFVRDNIAIPSDVFRDSFGKFFKVENEKVVAVGRDGNPIYSKTRAGELANFDEAIAHLVDTHSAKDQMLRTQTGPGGTGNNGNGGRQQGAARTVRRADFDRMNPSQQSALAAQMGKGEVNIVD